MKKGFTLVELLAVLIILAVILLIAIPIVQKTIQNSKVEAKKSSIELYGRAVNHAIEMYQLTNHSDPESFSDIEEYIEYSGEKVECLTSNINSNMTAYLADCSVGNVKVDEYSFGTLEYVYMWYEGMLKDGSYKLGPSLNDVINPSDYPTSVPSDVDFYLKFKLNNEFKIIEGYACGIIETEEICLKGFGNYYGYSTNESDYTNNALIIKDLKDKGRICTITDSSMSCTNSPTYVNFYASSNGHVRIKNVYKGMCSITDAGVASCESN